MNSALQDWKTLAACAGMDTEMFFPHDNRRKGEQEKTRKALEACARCPVRLDCLEDSIEHEDQYGIFGGMNKRERDAYAGVRP